LLATLEAVNAVLDHHEVIKRFVIMDGDWTVENGCLTPTMKIKRRIVEKQHREAYPGWYESSETVVWMRG